MKNASGDVVFLTHMVLHCTSFCHVSHYFFWFHCFITIYVFYYYLHSSASHEIQLYILYDHSALMFHAHKKVGYVSHSAVKFLCNALVCHIVHTLQHEFKKHCTNCPKKRAQNQINAYFLI